MCKSSPPLCLSCTERRVFSTSNVVVISKASLWLWIRSYFQAISATDRSKYPSISFRASAGKPVNKWFLTSSFWKLTGVPGLAFLNRWINLSKYSIILSPCIQCLVANYLYFDSRWSIGKKAHSRASHISVIFEVPLVFSMTSSTFREALPSKCM